MPQTKRIFSKLRHAVRRLSKSSTPDPALTATTANGGPPQTITVPGSSVSVSVPEDLQAKLEYNPQLNAPLENLPPEVRRQLLSILGLEELRALVFASPVFHQQYILDRRFLLCKCLETTLRNVTVDAFSVYQSGLSGFLNTRTNEKVTQFLKSYQHRRSLAQYSILTESLTEDEVVGVVAFHSSIIKPLTRYYTSWALANLANETKDLQSHEPLSKAEETRLMRALYRFQLCCNLFGVGRHGTSRQATFRFRSVDILTIFICIFEPWQVEEIACIYTFAEEKYDQIFRDISWDVNEKNPKFDGQRPPTPEGAFDLDNNWVRDSLLKGTISRGLELLHTVFKISDHKHLVSTMQQHISWPRGNFLGNEALGETAQFQRRRERPSHRDQKQQRHDPLPFEGDDESDANGLRPPLAWALMWRGTYSNLYGYYVQDVIRRWGYVMWDAARLEHTGAKKVLARQWEEDWRDSDPRDDLL
ncbi:hypothetical protein QBC46DRAFT_396979 [Diplogelasinospora grovesii]|uniref:F-box domain-containing protein n=1 Tax=Diplogelasinospora grovesii TaxID=303347 RepID=A0AAN6MZM5_9PEZI|nr:hypothetical protein QBC46DRAFT_396979 [Diplogelasinospora grovesii]